MRSTALGLLLLALFTACGASAEPSSVSDCIPSDGAPAVSVAQLHETTALDACLQRQCTENVQCGDPGRSVCVEVEGPHGQAGIWSCPIGCCTGSP